VAPLNASKVKHCSSREGPAAAVCRGRALSLADSCHSGPGHPL